MQIKTPRDFRGNELVLGVECIVIPKIPFIFKVIAVENGGIQTPQGVTAAHVRLVSDISLRQLPGVPFDSIVRIVTPTDQELIESLASKLART